MNDIAGKPALFLDRDGIINFDSGFVSKIKEFKFLDGIFDLCNYFASLNYRIIIITNQSGIGRGLFSLDDFLLLNNWMLKEFENNGCKIDLVLTSALNPDNQLASRRELSFRKPAPGMIFAAQEIFNIDLTKSLLIGDRDSDIQAGKSAGLSHLFLVNSKQETIPDAICFPNLSKCLIRLQEMFKTTI